MEADTRRLPIGVQSFERLREDGFLYVDKTEYIWKLLHGGKQYFLSRPRRFGKSLFLSTLRAYWEGKRELFTGLHIEQLEKDNQATWEPYPVFYFDFNGKNYQETNALEEVLHKHLSSWEQDYGIENSDQPLSARFQDLLKSACERTGRRCVVLVDEYDKPLLEVLQKPEQEEHNKAVFKGFFGTLKSYDEYLQFVLFTGVTKFSKVSIFSDLNQLMDISPDLDYAAVCGITEEELKENLQPEIRRTAEAQHISEEECLSVLKQTYDGYHFHPKGEGVYNPFSLLNALQKKEFGYYWFETGTPTFLVKRLREVGFDVRKFTDRTLYAGPRELSDYRGDNPDPLPLLYQTGYLTIVDYDARRQRYTLGFPNEEVKYGLLECLMPEYTSNATPGNGLDIYTLDEFVESGKLEEIRAFFTALFESIPYPPAGKSFEHDFQTVIYLVFSLLGKFVLCESHSSRGRADCVLKTDKYIYLFEFKLDDTAENALKQIEEKGYALSYAADPRQLFKIGIGFSSSSRTLTDWKLG